MEKIEINLKKEIEATNKDGNFIKSNTIIIEEPTFEIWDDIVVPLVQEIAKSMIKAGTLSKTEKQIEKEEETEKKEVLDSISAAQCLIFLYAGDADMQKCNNYFKKILKKSAKLDGEIELKDSHFLNFGIDDFNTMLGEYIKSFLLKFVFPK